MFNFKVEYSKELTLVKKLGQYYYVIGVINSDKRKDEDSADGLSNAEILVIHEFGSPLRKIPKRPILDLTIQKSQEMINKTIDKCLEIVWDTADEEKIKQELERTALRIETLARKLIYSNQTGFAKNSPYTIKMKGSDIPLLNTGELAKSIVCQLRKD